MTMKLKLMLVTVLAIAYLSMSHVSAGGQSSSADSEEVVVSDEGDEVVFREVRSAKARPRANNSGNGNSRNSKQPSVCRYTKGAWDECNPVYNTRTRTLTLKKGDEAECEVNKVETRKCKKACRYTKGQWSPCDGTTPMKERIDQLKQGSDPSCEPTRKMTKKCKNGKSVKAN